MTRESAPTNIRDSVIAGAFAGIAADSILHPFDTISLRLKVQAQNPAKYESFWHACKTIVHEGIES